MRRIAMKKPHVLALACLVSGVPFLAGGCGRETRMGEPGMTMQPKTDSKQDKAPAANEVATFGAGCFWCVEAVLKQVDGVVSVRSGYMGGTVPNPTYQQVCTGTTGHAEVVEITFDPARISYEKLLAWFWKLHDPTTRNRQGNDVGTQYRSAIFYHTEAQREAAERSKKALEASGAYQNPLVTEITKAGPFYQAEEYHQDYYRLNKQQPYCRYVIAPKLDKLGLEQ
jgi:peptide-methionine (S)-S-oxide reductase